MIKHNLLVIFRNFKRNKNTFFINLIGLSTGLACSLFIFIWINDEINVDKFHEKDSQLFQVMQNYQLANGTVTWDYTPARLAKALTDSMPEVESAVSLDSKWWRPKGILSNGNTHVKAKGRYAGKDYFQVFSYALIRGDNEKVFIEKNAMAISEKLAYKLFHTTENIIGKTINANSDLYKETFHVSGVFKSPPENSTDQFDFLANFEFFLKNSPWSTGWNQDPAETYIILKKGTNIDHFNKKIAGFLRSKHPGRKPSTLFVQQYSKRYLFGQYEDGNQTGGRIAYVRLFSIVAAFILLIACINFMNLSTAKASTRTKEIGIKKTVGANRYSIIIQFLGEALLMAFVSLLVACLLVELLLPQYNALTGKNIHLGYHSQFLLFILGIALFTGIVSGGYPALYLSGFSPIHALKEKYKTSRAGVWIRKGLVIFQFAISTVFIVGVFIVNKQIDLTQTKHLGYNRKNVLCFEWNPTAGNDPAGFVSGLKNIPGVVNASHMSGNILSDIFIGSGYSWRGEEQDKQYAFKNLQIDADFIETLDMKITAGRSFSREFNDDHSKIIFNEAAIKMMGLKNPVGTFIEYGNEGDHRQIVGVVRDFHYGSLHERMEPLVFSYKPNGRNIYVRIESGAEKATIERLKKYYQKFHAGLPMEYTFLDEEYQSLYNSEIQTGSLLKYFSAVAVIISCLGLLGLAAFTVQKRQKEIGIRKVLGSSEFGIVLLLTNGFSKMVLAAIGIAIPVSYLILRTWLNGFAYRIDLEPWIFVSAGLITLAIAWITVSVQTFKAAGTNPVKSLKYE